MIPKACVTITLHSATQCYVKPAPTYDILSPSNTPQFLRNAVSGGDKILVGTSVSKVAEPYSATLFSSAAAIRSLADRAKPLLEQHRTCQPDFFLASVSEKHWKACAVAVTYNDDLVGIVYVKERLFLGCRTGIVYTDTTLGMNIVAEPLHREHVLSVAVRAILASVRVRALRLVVPREGSDPQTISKIATSTDMEMVSFQVANHSHLALPSSYDDFLNGLGSRTRRNFRYYRRRFEATGGYYVGSVPFERYCSAAWHLRRKSSIPADGDGIKRVLKMLSAISEPILVGLQAADGEWLSVAGGWCEGERATVLFQMNNDREYQRDSLSQVLRSYLIEELIASRIHDLVFWAGTSAPLARYVEGIPAFALYLDSRNAGWHLFRTLVSSIASRLPARIASRLPTRLMEFGQWITPARR